MWLPRLPSLNEWLILVHETVLLHRRIFPFCRFLMTPLGILFTTLFCLGVMVLPKRWAALCYLGGTLYLTQGQSVLLSGINFMAIRFVEVAAFTRILLRGEFSGFSLSKLDRLLLLSLVWYESALMLRTMALDFYGIGVLCDAALVFITFRVWLGTLEDYEHFMKWTGVLMIPFTACMVVESINGRNLFAIMGGVPDESVFREGHYRCQASFRHSITAGSVGAVFLPLYIGLAADRSKRAYALLGVLCSALILITSRSSGPLLAAMSAVVGWLCWTVRFRMYLVRLGIISIFVFLHFTMSKPVWFIFDRISSITGGDGWHRSNLIDQFLKHASEWWIAGMPIENTGDWAATKMSWGGIDITNHYVSLGVGGGLISVVLFITFIKSGYSAIGKAMLRLREREEMEGGLLLQSTLWGVGAMFCAHTINLTAVLYWDQSYVVFYIHMAMVSSLTQYFMEMAPASELAFREHSSSAPLIDRTEFDSANAT